MKARRGAKHGAAAWHGAAGLGAAALVRSSFAARAGSRPFYLLTASLAGTWAGGALGAGPIPWRGAGLITSVIFGWQRGATGGVLAPAVTHVTWSVLMLRYLPPLFSDADRPPAPKSATNRYPLTCREPHA